MKKIILSFYVLSIFYFTTLGCKKEESYIVDHEDFGYVDLKLGERDWYNRHPQEKYSTQVYFSQDDLDICSDEKYISLNIMGMQNVKFFEYNLFYILLPLKMEDRITNPTVYKDISSRLWLDHRIIPEFYPEFTRKDLFKDSCNSLPKVSYYVSQGDAPYVEFLHNPLLESRITIDKFDGKILEGSFEINMINRFFLDAFPSEQKFTSQKFIAEYRKK